MIGLLCAAIRQHGRIGRFPLNEKKQTAILKRTACAFLAFGVLCQASISTAFAASQDTAAPATSSSTTSSLKDELSKNGNVVTEYINEEDHLPKTILWTQGITPPQMGGPNNEFKKQLVYDANGEVAYIDYIAPYKAGNGWYDVNKSEHFVQNDENLCFAASASNSLHWWLTRNAKNIDRYLEQNPEDPQIQRLNYLRNSFENQQHSGIYDIFLRQFANKQDGYWPDILQDQFLNGYYLKPNGGTNDAPADRDKLQEKGPDRNGGFFFKAFGPERLTQRRYYQNGYEPINRELRYLLMEGNIVLLSFRAGPRSHVVTLWGAEFDQNGNICAVYYTDSDDEISQGMLRFRLVNVDGKAAITTRADGKSTNFVEALQVLSPGTELWQRYFQDPKLTLDLNWSSTDLIYNGQMQAPTVSASNLAAGDQITLSVEGGGVNAGTYTATAVLSGPDADKYVLPENHTHTFEIKQAPPPHISYPSAGALEYGQALTDSPLTGGSQEYGQFVWENPALVPTVSNSGYRVNFIPSEATKQNYLPINALSSLVPLAVRKATPAITADASLSQAEGSVTMTLTAAVQPVGLGEAPTGTVTFSIVDENGNTVADALTAALVNGVASASWTGEANKTYMVQAAYSGSANYNLSTSAPISVDTGKQAQTEFHLQPIGTKTYGDSTFTLETTGGSGTGAITFTSSNPEVLSVSGSTVTVKAAGTAVITATKAGDTQFNETSDSISVVVNKRALTVIADSKPDVMQGDALPELTYTVEGLVNGDRFADPKLTVTADNTLVPGEYQIFVQGGNLTHAESYAITYVTGTLTIQAKELPPVPSKPTEPDAGTKPGETGHSNTGTPPTDKPMPTQPDKNAPTVNKHESAPAVSKNESTSTVSNPESAVTDAAQTSPVTVPEESSTPASLPEADPAQNPGSDEAVSSQESSAKQQDSGKGGHALIISLLAAAAALLIVLFVLLRKRSKSKQ